MPFPAPTSASAQGSRSLGIATAAELVAVRRDWRPWGAYAVQHLWATGGHAVNQMPSEPAA